jgi:signal transduction histidine kinase
MAEVTQSGTQESSRSWAPWPGTAPLPGAPADVNLPDFRLRVFRMVVAFGCLALTLVVLRGVALHQPVQWPDLISALFLLLVYWLVRRRRAWLPLLTWLVLAALFADALDSLPAWQVEPITPTHLLMPLLVLYGALLGDILLSLTAMGLVLLCYGYTWWLNSPLSEPELVTLTNLCIFTIFVGLACFAVWVQQRRLLDTLHSQSVELRRELESRMRLNAVIRHDIRNPLSGLMGIVQLARRVGHTSERELDTIDRLAHRIAEIAASVRDVSDGEELTVATTTVSVGTLWAELHDLLAHALAEKDQSLVMTFGTELLVTTNRQLLCNFVLSNLLTSAIAFSPRGSQIEMCARRESDSVRIELRDNGRAFSQQMHERASARAPAATRLATEGERGTGRSMQIAALYLRRLHGRLEFRNLENGAAVAVVLPSATTDQR